MHTLEQQVATAPTPAYIPCVTFTGEQLATAATSPSPSPSSSSDIGALVAEKTKRGSFFYGIEITARWRGKPTCVDFNEFLPVLPAFISLVWLGREYCDVEDVESVPTVALARHLSPYIPVLPHLTAYRITQRRLDAFLGISVIRNVLLVRGDDVDDQQDYTSALQLVKHTRHTRNETISIGIGGFPEGHRGDITAIDNPHTASSNILALKHKVDAGADFIITQFCYRSDRIISFVRECREQNITVPIVMGVLIPDSLSTYNQMVNITGVRLPPDLEMEIHGNGNGNGNGNNTMDMGTSVGDFFIALALRIIQEVREADVGIHGVQFFTLNRFQPVYTVIDALRERNILQE